MVQALKTRPVPRQKKITYEEFLEFPWDNPRVEWIDGEVIEMSPVSRVHSSINGFLFKLISHFAEHFDLGEVLFDPFNMKTGPSLAGRAPDILFVAKENLDRLKDNHLSGPADLVVEIISPDDPNRDRVVKFREYEAGGVKEYWLIDPIQRTADFYLLDPDGIYQKAPIGEDGAYRSTVLKGLWIRVDWLWRNPMPKTLDVLKEWGIIA